MKKIKMTPIEIKFSEVKTEALKLKHHVRGLLTYNDKKRYSTFLTGTPITVKGVWAYVECGVINHLTLKETVKFVQVRFHD
jgi:predicted methyltransferase